MHVQLSGISRPRLAALAIITTLAVVTVGFATTSVLVAPLLILCVLATGLFFMSGAEVGPIERLILIPAVGVASLAIASLLIPLSAALGLVAAPARNPAVVAVCAALPTVLAISYWASRPSPVLSSFHLNRRLLVPLVPVVLGAGGSLVQWQFGVVVQNYLVMALLAVMGPALLSWAHTEFEAAVSLYGLAMGVLFSHTLVTGYSVGVDVQMSLHTIEQVTATGTWPINDIFFEVGASDAPLSALMDYIGSGLAHTGLPVVIGVPIIFEVIGNTTPEFVFDVVFVGLFALTPVAIFRLGREELSVREAFVAGMVFIAYYRFFHTSPAKQHLAQFFMAALLVAWLTRFHNPRAKIMTALLAVGIVFSHYAVTFLFFGFLFSTYLLSKWFVDRPSPSPLSLLFLGYFYSLVTLWYIVVTGAEKPLAAASAIAISVEQLLSGAGPQSRTGAQIATEQTLLVDQFNLGLHGLLLGAIILGVLAVVVHALRTREPLFSVEIDSLSLGLLMLLILSLVVSGHLGIDRALDISLVVLAPIAVLGVRETLAVVGERLTVPTLSSYTYSIGVVFVVLLFVFSSGLAYEATGNPATSAINLHEEPNSVMFSAEEYEAATFLMTTVDDSTVYSTSYTSTVFHRISGRSLPYFSNIRDFESEIDVDLNEPGYVFVRKSAITDRSYPATPRHLLQREEYRSLADQTEPVYENEDVVVLRIDPSDQAAASTTEATFETTTLSSGPGSVSLTQANTVPLNRAIR